MQLGDLGTNGDRFGGGFGFWWWWGVIDDDTPAGRDADVDTGDPADVGFAGGVDWAGDVRAERVSPLRLPRLIHKGAVILKLTFAVGRMTGSWTT